VVLLKKASSNNKNASAYKFRIFNFTSLYLGIVFDVCKIDV